MTPVTKILHPDLAHRNSKPLGEVEIDWSNKHTRDLKYCPNFATPYMKNLVSHNSGLLRNGASIVPTREGLALKTDGTNDVLDCGPLGSVNFELHATVMFRVKTADDTGTYVSQRDGANRVFQIYTGSGPEIIVGRGNGQTNMLTDSRITDDKWHMICVTFVDFSLDLYIDGVFEVTQSNTSNPENAENLSIGARWESYPATGYEMAAEFTFMGIWDRILADHEIKQLSDNPNQVFIPTAQIIPFTIPAVGGGTGKCNPMYGPLGGPLHGVIG